LFVLVFVFEKEKETKRITLNESLIL